MDNMRKRWERRDKVITGIVMTVLVGAAAVIIYTVAGPVWDKFMK
jgi:hypothetical protein